MPRRRHVAQLSTTSAPRQHDRQSRAASLERHRRPWRNRTASALWLAVGHTKHTRGFSSTPRTQQHPPRALARLSTAARARRRWRDGGGKRGKPHRCFELQNDSKSTLLILAWNGCAHPRPNVVAGDPPTAQIASAEQGTSKKRYEACSFH